MPGSIIVTGAPQLIRRLNAVKDGKPTLRDIQIRAVREAKQRVARKTGHTGRTIHPADLTDSYAIIRAGGAAVFLEEGTRPHVIVPRRAKVLSWTEGKRLSGRNRTGKAAGDRIFARRVHHPGTRAQPFMVPATEEAIRQVGVTAIIKSWNDAG